MTLLVPAPAFCIESSVCQPSAQVQQELDKVLSEPAEEMTSFEHLTEPFGALRVQFPKNLFVHLRYQDAVSAHGIEGHLKAMLREYESLRKAHPGDLFYLYLYGHALEGRRTPQAITMMEQVLTLDPNFAPAHQTLAEIFGSVKFGDPKREEVERAKFHAACPHGVIAKKPSQPSGPSAFWAKAERLLDQRLDDSRELPKQVYQALQQEEWRLQTTRPFDWYTVEQKKQVAAEVQSAYWTGWRILVQHYWKTDQPEKADQLISEMEGRLTRIRTNQDSALYWTGAMTLLELYAKDDRAEKSREMLGHLENFVAEAPNHQRAIQLAQFKSKYLRRKQVRPARFSVDSPRGPVPRQNSSERE